MTVKSASEIKNKIGPKLSRLRKYQLEPEKGRAPLTAAVYLAEVYRIAKETRNMGSMRAIPAVELWLEQNPIKGAEIPRSTSLEALIIGATCNQDKRIRSRWARAIAAVVDSYEHKLSRLEFDAVLNGLGGIAGAAKTIRTPRKRKFGGKKVAKKKTSTNDGW